MDHKNELKCIYNTHIWLGKDERERKRITDGRYLTKLWQTDNLWGFCYFKIVIYRFLLSYFYFSHPRINNLMIKRKQRKLIEVFFNKKISFRINRSYQSLLTLRSSFMSQLWLLVNKMIMISFVILPSQHVAWFLFFFVSYSNKLLRWLGLLHSLLDYFHFITLLKIDHRERE